MNATGRRGVVERVRPASWVLFCLAAACGRAEKNGARSEAMAAGATSTGTGGSSTGASSSGGASGVGGATGGGASSGGQAGASAGGGGRDASCGPEWSPIPGAANCAYPLRPGFEPPLVDSVLSLSVQGCLHQLGAPRELPFSGALAFAFDVNADSVDDLFFWSDDDAHSLQMAVSRVDDGEVVWEAEGCDALSEIPYGKVFLRDLNGDGVLDLVIGAGDQYLDLESPVGADPDFHALLNLPDGFEPVLAHRFGELASESILWDVASADFDADGDCLDDLALGYRRVFDDGALGWERGALVSFGQGDRYADAEVWSDSGSSESPFPQDQPWLSGNLAAGLEDGASVLFLVQGFSSPETAEDDHVFPGLLLRHGSDGWDERTVTTTTPAHETAGYSTEPIRVWIAPFDGVESALWALQERELVVHDLRDASLDPLPVLYRHPLVERHLWRPEYDQPPLAFAFLLDVEGDGDLDFIEQMGSASDFVALHVNQNGTRLADGVILEYTGPRTWMAEDPFVTVGWAEAAFVVNDSSFEAPLATVQALECLPP